jgi:hypothetical protein
MNLVPETIARSVGRSGLLVQKNSPGVLFAAGVVGMVGTTVLACRATLKVDAILDDAKRKMTLADTLQHDDYDDMDRRRDKTLVRYQTAVKIGKEYAPAVVLGALSITALTRSHYILTQRNTALIAAYAALDKGFREYRSRVVAKYGEEEDRDLRYGVREIKSIDPETQEEKVVKRVAPGGQSVYARFFDASSSSWSKDPEVNLFFLKSQQNYANDQLTTRGHVFLNEVYDLLGLERSSAGSVVGWVLSRDGSTDNHIDFGIFDKRSQAARDFVNGFEGAILLDFNVDGVIYDKIDGLPEGLGWQLNH